MQRKLEIFVAAITALIAVGSFLGTFILLPYRVAATEEAIAGIRLEAKEGRASRLSDHELLARIDERMRLLQIYIEGQKLSTYKLNP